MKRLFCKFPILMSPPSPSTTNTSNSLYRVLPWWLPFGQVSWKMESRLQWLLGLSLRRVLPWCLPEQVKSLYRVLPWWLPFGESCERRNLAHNDYLGSAYVGSYPDAYPSESRSYIGSYPDGYPSESLLKDEISPTMTTWAQPISGPTLIAIRASQDPIAGPTLMVTPWGVSWKTESRPKWLLELSLYWVPPWRLPKHLTTQTMNVMPPQTAKQRIIESGLHHGTHTSTSRARDNTIKDKENHFYS